MIPGISWAVFSTAPTVKSNIPPTRVPTLSMFTMTTAPPTIGSTVRATIHSTPVPSLLKAVVSQQASPTQQPNTAPPTVQPSVQPTITPSFRPTPTPTASPTQEFITSLTPTTASGVSSINSASNSQTTTSSMAVGVGVGCLILVMIVIGACIFVSRKKKSPYQIWASHYSNRQSTPLQPRDSMNEDIHHFYNKNQRPPVLQHTVFTPHVSSRQSFRNSQITYPSGPKRLSFNRSPPQMHAI